MNSMRWMIAILMACFLLTLRPVLTASAEGQVLQEISANGVRNLRPFTVKDKWEIQWESKGTMLTITIYQSDGTLGNIAALQNGPGSGASYQPKGGEFYLQLSGTGEWTVRVVQLP